LRALENVHQAHLKKLSRDEESGCFFDAEAEFETREENFNFDLYHNRKVEKTIGTQVLCNITEVNVFHIFAILSLKKSLKTKSTMKNKQTHTHTHTHTHTSIHINAK